MLIVVYSHTEYMDVLKIQTKHLSNYKNKILIINKSDKYEIYNEYKDIIYYDDSLPYASRLLELKNISDEIKYKEIRGTFRIYHDPDVVFKSI